MQPKVSMVMPCYNKVDYIGRMLASVCRQTWDNLELILVNDGATDGTREVIAAWEPRLRERGYQVLVIDQQNAGINAAVYHGMKQVTGEFFCCVDCDDELAEGYVMTMATALMENPDCQWAYCEYDYYNGQSRAAPYQYPARPGAAAMLKDYVSYRVVPYTWIYLVRTSYLRRCAVMEQFVLTPSVTQEPCLALPMIAGGGKLYHCNDVLYHKDMTAERGSPVMEGAALSARFISDYRDLLCAVVKRLPLPPAETDVLQDIAQLCFSIQAAVCRKEAGGEPDAVRAALSEGLAAAGRLFPGKFPACEEKFLRSDPRLSFFAAGSLLAGHVPEMRIHPRGRVIGYGALGKLGRQFAALSTGTPLAPALLWDRGAADGARVCGVTVTAPDAGALLPTDTIAVYPRSEGVEDEVRLLAEPSGASVSGYLDVLESLAAWYAPFAHCGT